MIDQFLNKWSGLWQFVIAVFFVALLLFGLNWTG